MEQYAVIPSEVSQAVAVISLLSLIATALVISNSGSYFERLPHWLALTVAGVAVFLVPALASVGAVFLLYFL